MRALALFPQHTHTQHGGAGRHPAARPQAKAGYASWIPVGKVKLKCVRACVPTETVGARPAFGASGAGGEGQGLARVELGRGGFGGSGNGGLGRGRSEGGTACCDSVRAWGEGLLA